MKKFFFIIMIIVISVATSAMAKSPDKPGVHPVKGPVKSMTMVKKVKISSKIGAVKMGVKHPGKTIHRNKRSRKDFGVKHHYCK